MVRCYKPNSEAEAPEPVEPTCCKWVTLMLAQRFRTDKLTTGRRKYAQSSPIKDKPRGSGTQTCKDQRIQKTLELTSLMVARARTSTHWPQLQISSDQPPDTGFQTIRQHNSGRPAVTILPENKLADVKMLHNRLAMEQDTAWLHPLPADHLLSLVYYNVCRALISNIAILGLDLNLMSTQDYPSPFLPSSPTASSLLGSLPTSLQPTELQRTISHHPEYDILPDPTMRDNFLCYGEDNVDDAELCLDMTGNGVHNEVQDAAGQAGFIVWGDPWDLMSWEVTEKFVRKWAWILKGCVDLEVSTNRWRKKRGVAPLRVREIVEEIAGRENET
jgi:hypothetical protein